MSDSSSVRSEKHEHTCLACKHTNVQVVRYLKELGIKDDHLKQRILAICPSVLMRSVDDDVKPTISLLTSLGVEVSLIFKILL